MSDSHTLTNIIEALLHASDESLTVARMRNVFPEDARPTAEAVNQAIDELIESYQDRPINLLKVGNGFRFQTAMEYAQWVGKLFEMKPLKLSRAMLETLAIIAYRQPATRGDIQEVRGVSVSSDIMQRLLEREWIKKIGIKEVPGHPALYGTTQEFLSYFGLSSLRDLPVLREERELDQIVADLGDAIRGETTQAIADKSVRHPPESGLDS